MRIGCAKFELRPISKSKEHAPISVRSSGGPIKQTVVTPTIARGGDKTKDRMPRLWALALVALSGSGWVSAASSDDLLPTVSIMMPTRSRPEFVRRALAQIAAQDYPRHKIKQVVVVDDSDAAFRLSADDFKLTPSVPVEYVVLEEPASVGAKRNLAAEQATGQVVVHWDDDDVFSAQRLRASVAPIARGRADMTVLTHSYTWFMDRGCVGPQSILGNPRLFVFLSVSGAIMAWQPTPHEGTSF
jgi:cellulose synthase/poly-beta-1,6-N-acetylglucosamine synthase-like glycosyltransferase